MSDTAITKCCTGHRKPSANVVSKNGYPVIAGGRKKALLIGINYSDGEFYENLIGCHQDVENVRKLLVEMYDFVDDPSCMRVLKDDKPQTDQNCLPTKENIQAAMKWLSEGVCFGDSLFLHFSGHIMQEDDKDADEDDELDEHILPMDYKTAGIITDDYIYDVMIRDLPEGCRFTAFIDACHSGTALDLPYNYLAYPINLKGLGVENIRDAGWSKEGELTEEGDSNLNDALPNQELTASANISTSAKPLKRKPQDKTTRCMAIAFAACQDAETSVDQKLENRPAGALSWALVKSLRNNPAQSYSELLASIRKLLMSVNKDQIPQLTSGYIIDVNETFTI